MNRRDAIKALGTVLGAATASKLLAACGDNAGSEAGITHFVFLMMENRSYDHVFGARSLLEGRAGDGLTADMANPDLDGSAVPIFEGDASILCVEADPPHGWDASRTQLNSGTNDGFVIAHQQRHGAGAIDPMGYLTRAQMPVSYALADEYTTCDRWFCSVLGPTLPNRMYWHAATSNGAQANDEVLGGAFKGVTSIYHRLEAAGVDWGYYYGDVPVLAFVENIEKRGKLKQFFPNFMIDAAAGELPPVTYIDPAFTCNDDHPPHHVLAGQELIAAIYQALATSPLWNNVLLVVTYDENGGFFDHVAPPTTADDNAALGFDQLGFRVPTMVIGPYVKTNYVSSVQYDHTSAIKHLSNEFNLAPLTARDAAATDLTDCIDLVRLAEGRPNPPIELPAVDVSFAEIDACKSDGVLEREYDHDIVEWADKNPDALGDYDLRHQTEEMVRGISAFLKTSRSGAVKTPAG